MTLAVWSFRKKYATLRIKEGDPLEIYTDHHGEVILKKYSPISELTDFAKEYAEVLAQSSGHAVCITDRDQVVAAGGGRKDCVGKIISEQLGTVIQERNQVLSGEDGKHYVKVTLDEYGGRSAAGDMPHFVPGRCHWFSDPVEQGQQRTYGRDRGGSGQMCGRISGTADGAVK